MLNLVSKVPVSGVLMKDALSKAMIANAATDEQEKPMDNAFGGETGEAGAAIMNKKVKAH